MQPHKPVVKNLYNGVLMSVKAFMLAMQIDIIKHPIMLGTKYVLEYNN